MFRQKSKSVTLLKKDMKDGRENSIPACNQHSVDERAVRGQAPLRD